LKISVFGIGYVGAVSAACLAEAGHEVIAVDRDARRIAAINEGRAPLFEPGLEALIAKHAATGRLAATDDADAAVTATEATLICVGTPGSADGTPDLSDMRALCLRLGAILRGKPGRHTVVSRSTALPGTLENVIRPLLEEASGKKAGRDFGLGVNPEFLREGSAIADYSTPELILAGANDSETAETIFALYPDINAPHEFCAPGIAEGLKYVSNAWRANKVAFANEAGSILKAHGIDSHAVMDLFFRDMKQNLGPSYLLPGFAFGGSCLPKDVRALRASANDRGVRTPLFDALTEANEAQIRRALALVRETGRRRAGLLGLSFKPGTDDLRESPLVRLALLLLEDGFELCIYDPCVRRTIAAYPRLAPLLAEDAAAIHDKCDVVIAGSAAPECAAVAEALDPAVPLIDLVRLGGDMRRRANYAGICW
jgi:GDP-mannose 6-dehydrogenase